MLKKSVTYMNFDDEIVTEDLFFNLTKAEIMELETSEEGGFIASMQKVVANENAGAALVGFKRLIMMAYGEKVGPDKKFVKVYNGVNLSEAFVATEAYSTILMELSSDATIAAAFINGLLPKDLVQAAQNQLTIEDVPKPVEPVVEDVPVVAEVMPPIETQLIPDEVPADLAQAASELTDEQLRTLSPDELIAYFQARKPQ